ncbi:MAG TPA: tetratricopeptide repeat protein [Thermoanaerobaculia bacterium]|nr:tetratricopeptide repeat protein [Thermoanaerobaculia bacterium]
MRPILMLLLLAFPWAAVSVSAQTPERIQAVRAEAETGDARAQYILGKFLEQSDPAEATRWYRKAADQGQRNAQTSLGFAYLEGRGIAKDDAEAARWYRKAAEQGEQLAQWQLAWMSSEGRGVPANEEEALKWYEAVIATDAADGESGRHPMTEMAKPAIADIYSRRASIYEMGFGAPKDPALGFYWLSRASQLDPELYAAHLTDRAKSLSAEQRADAERRILEWATAKDHGGPEDFAPALAALHAAGKIPPVPDPKKDHRPR